MSDGLATRYGERFGISIPEWRVLATIGEFGSVTAKAIGRHAHMGKVKVSRAAASLEARGFLRKLPNEEDLREAFLVLTDAGRSVYAEIAPLALDYAARLMEGFTPAERDVLDVLLCKLQGRAEAMADDRSPSLGAGRTLPRSPS
ncbi:MarR family winged helix-turn-helix transcriptional regulator [Enterovirga rhinocerotis]|uniref:MarR family winged helix-turn-helix transcriptional regulator n=1 Tax=Enterovirga rhinocerotis TaxID=1339210 RepID=UPI001FE2249B|nr:MarR family transcriptional regulator [Enterovirga rhinocerotis]